MSNQKKILSLQGLRAVMFFLIFFFHSDLYLDRYFVFNRFFIGGGCLAVSVFFVLSGFVTGLSNKKVHSISEYIYYIKNKIGKFYLSHLIFLILSIPLSYYFFLHEIKGKVSLILDLVLMQSWVSDSAVWRSYNGLAWFLSTLLFCYLMVPVAQYLFDKICEGKQKKYLVLIMIQAFIISLMLCFVIQVNVEYWLYAFPPVRLLDFYSGYVLAKIYMEHDLIRTEKVGAQKYTIFEVLLFVNMVILMFAYPFVNVGLRRQALYFPFSLCIVYLFAIGKGRVSKILSMKWVEGIGNNSFYYYISHQVILKWVFKIYERTPFIANRSFLIDFLLVILCLMLTISSQKVIDCFLNWDKKSM